MDTSQKDETNAKRMKMMCKPWFTYDRLDMIYIVFYNPRSNVFSLRLFIKNSFFRVGFYNQEKEFDERGLDLKTTKFQQGYKLQLIFLTRTSLMRIKMRCRR